MEPFVLTDGEIWLASPRSADAQAITRICQDESIQRWTTVPVPYALSDGEFFVNELVPAQWAKGAMEWAIRIGGPDNEPVGMISLFADNDGSREIGYYLAPQARGKGLLQRALKLVADHAFAEMGVEVLTWSAFVGNWNSWKSAWRFGFRKEGVRRKMGRIKPGQERADMWVASLLPTDPRGVPAGPWDGPGVAGELPLDPHDPEALVRQFHATYLMPMGYDVPTVDFDRIGMRMSLILEECAELVGAVYGKQARAAFEAAMPDALQEDDHTRDVVEAADALADLVYVIYGMAIEAGISLPRVLAEVQASNLSKLGADGKPIYRADGKVLKGPGFFPPNVARALGLPRTD
ncbi:MAG: bifunctional GNAT family N-acetyltransferase/nucleoside triphosphate pyrophosphohydrolase family protein [Buchananella hordeovulneris]|nr:bifunctional GNAT family N-acetyltransferase/nucleoside triphosphate pyrophosphohydrolase family protein [Buchananella hordeovulneris]